MLITLLISCSWQHAIDSQRVSRRLGLVLYSFTSMIEIVNDVIKNVVNESNICFYLFLIL